MYQLNDHPDIQNMERWGEKSPPKPLSHVCAPCNDALDNEELIEWQGKHLCRECIDAELKDLSNFALAELIGSELVIARRYK